MSEGVDLTPTGFVRYDANGGIISRGNASRTVLDAYRDQGLSVLEIPEFKVTLDESAIKDDDYVDLSGKAPVLKDRPEWTTAPSPNPVAAGVEAVIAGLPACTVSFAGPTNGTQAHELGADGKPQDLAIGFGVPGDYTLTFEAFPYKPATFKLTVQG